MKRPPQSRKRHPLEAAYRSTVEGFALSLQSLADLLRSLRALEEGWYLGSAACPRPEPIGRGGRGRVGGERGRHGRAGSPPRCGSTHKTKPQRRKKGLCHPLGEALGTSRGRFSTKVHLACDGKGRPLSVFLTPGQRHSSTQLGRVLDGIWVPRLSGIGRPRKRPDHLIADKGYDFPSCRELLRKRGIGHTIPERRDRRKRRAKHPGRPPNFDASVYGRRNAVERCVNRLKHWRGRHPLREAGSQIPSRDCDRRIDDLVGIMNQQTKPSRLGPPE